eukprot:TRINITY_DN33348_c0_g1_i1.p1 TRINITY_DN33348_c0_g1~~TRINITY_DN33348_c0_g1_i1.p1  ORF type:complete len:336 (+),score=88.91 TRINITY_DN33348_c0_g1_i1:42-1049(+)
MLRSVFRQARFVGRAVKTPKFENIEYTSKQLVKAVTAKKNLVRVAQHPSGRIVKFDASVHSYLLGRERLGSITSVMKSRLMRDGEEVGPVTHPFDVEGIALKVATAQGRTVEDVKQEWADIATFGTKFHAYICEELTGETTPGSQEWSSEEKEAPLEQAYMKAFEEYITLLKDFGYELHPNGSEMIVFSPKYQLAGTIDCLMVCREGNDAEPSPHYLLLDWKTNKSKLRGQTPFPGSPQTLNWPCEDLPAVRLSEYQLQTNCYRHILQTEGYLDPSMPVLMAIVQFYQNESGEIDVDGVKVEHMDSIGTLFSAVKEYKDSKKPGAKKVTKKMPFA